MSATPIILIGRNPIIASKVREDLKPEYDGTPISRHPQRYTLKLTSPFTVIHIILSVQQAITDLPLLLSSPSQIPPDNSDNYGSQVYGARPRAVVIGGGFTDEMVQEMKSACKDAEGGIVWVKGNPISVKAMPPLSDRQAYGAATASLVKKKLDELNVGREGGEKKEGVHFYM